MSTLLRQGSLQEAGARQEAPVPPLAAKATEALRLGDFKQAIELFKRLVKQDARAEWRDALVEAYAGRARMLAARGMFEEAELALSKAAAPDGTIPDPLLQVQCLVKRGQLQKAAALAVQYIGNGKVPAPAAPRLAELAAALWLAAPVPLAPQADPKSEAGKWVEHAAAAQQSLAAWIEGKPPQEIDQLLSRIPLRSAFRALRLILKSLLTAPDDPARARQLLDGVPPESAFASFRLAVEAALPRGPDESAPADPMATPAGPSKAQQVFAVEVKGLPGAASQSLVQLTKAERSGPGALLSFLASQTRTLPADDVKLACFNLLPQAPHRLAQFESTFGPLSEFDRNRVLALGAEARDDWERAEQCWTVAAQRIEPAAGAETGLSEPGLAAGVIYRHLARLAHEHPEIEGEGTSEFPEIDYLELSVRADPDCLPAFLQLIALHRTHGRDRDWHRLADDAAQRFPEESAVLLQAVDSAIARKAYKKAVGFARKLLALDPINQAARQRMIELHISHARKQIRSKRTDLAWKELSEAATWERPGAPSFLLHINQGLVGLELGQKADAEARLRQGVELAGGGVAGWFRASLEHALMNAGEASAALVREELTRAQQAAAPTKEAIQSIVSAMSGKVARESKKAAEGLVFRIRGWLLKGSGLAWTAAEFHPVAEMFGWVNVYDLLGEYAKAAGRQDPDEDATWRYYQVVARTKGDPGRLSFAERDELFDMEEAAASRRDFHAVNRIRRFIEGPRLDPSPRRGSRRVSRPGAVNVDDDDEVDEVSALLASSLEDTPPEMVKSMVEKLGRREAVTALVKRLRASPLGTMPETLLRQIAKTLVESVIGTNGRPAHE
jgi:cellulose synthase operon protein C